MYKKIIIILSALIVLSLPYQQQYAKAAIFTKVATTGAKKAVKEIIKDSAIEIAMDMAINQAFKLAVEEQAKYKVQSDYELFCGKKMPPLVECGVPMQVKKAITDADKVAIGNQTTIEFEKLITGGKGFTGWQKFLDFFIPIWALSFGATALTYALDPDTRSLFNDAAYNALLAIGLIKPVAYAPVMSNADGTPIAEKPLASVTNPTSAYVGDWTKTNEYIYTAPSTNPTYDAKLTIPNKSVSSGMAYAQLADTPTNILNYWEYQMNTTQGLNSYFLIKMQNSVITIIDTITETNNNESGRYHPITNITVDGQPYLTERKQLSQTFTVNGFPWVGTSKIKSVQHRLPYEQGGFWYTDVLALTVDGHSIQFNSRSEIAPNQYFPTSTLTGMTLKTNANQTITGGDRAIKLSYYENATMFDATAYEPVLEELVQGNEPMEHSNYENDNKVTVIPPSALPYTQTSTGVQLEPVKNETTGDMEFKTPTGESVPEDDITVGDPVVQPAPKDNPQGVPEGTPQVQPPPTPSNPQPEPITLTPPPTNAPPIETLPPVFPEGQSCDVGLKLPKISPLAYAVSESFPFSIPFDLYDGFQAIFSEMGNEKPEFNYKFNFMGDQQEWKISIPDYFDSWKRFTDSFLIFVFDVGIIFMIFRFMGGNK